MAGARRRQLNTLSDGKKTSMNHRARREDDPHVQLAAAVLTGGYRDLVDMRAAIRDRARYFFESHRCELWADAVCTDYAVVREASVNVEENGLPDGDRRRERYRRARE